MSARLRDADAQAVDLLLDRAVIARERGDARQTAFFATAASISTHEGISNENIAAVERVLKLLDLMPAVDPGQELIQRTLARIDAHTGAPALSDMPSQIDHGRPV